MFQVPQGHRLDVRGVTVPVPPPGAPSPCPSTMRQAQGTATRCSILFQAGLCLSAAHCFNPGFLQHGQHPVPTTPVLPEVPLLADVWFGHLGHALDTQASRRPHFALALPFLREAVLSQAEGSILPPVLGTHVYLAWLKSLCVIINANVE